ncbi:MAG: hypothetical protein E4H36_13400 [Spirochaetales bacterium]|nr:MAG: hypothetical protein E4H36_13400 [Spirochaetales bacterium]
MTGLFLLPPNHAADILLERKRRLFRVLGLTSALALPPVMPLGYSREAPAGFPLPAARFPLVTGGWTSHQNAVFLQTEPPPPEMPAGWTGGSSGLAVPAGPFPGFYMCSLEEGAAFTQLLPVLGEAPVFSFSTLFVLYCSLECSAAPDWWRQVFSAELFRNKIHG